MANSMISHNVFRLGQMQPFEPHNWLTKVGVRSICAEMDAHYGGVTENIQSLVIENISA